VCVYIYIHICAIRLRVVGIGPNGRAGIKEKNARKRGFTTARRWNSRGPPWPSYKVGALITALLGGFLMGPARA